LGYFHQILIFWFSLFSQVLNHGFAATLHRRINKLSVRSPFPFIPSIAGRSAHKTGFCERWSCVLPG